MFPSCFCLSAKYIFVQSLFMAKHSSYYGVYNLCLQQRRAAIVCNHQWRKMLFIHSTETRSCNCTEQTLCPLK